MGFLKSLFGFEDEYTKLERIYPAPNANEAEYQKDALDSLRNGVLPSGFTANGYLCKKGEKVIYAFLGITHYCSSVHSEWTGRSAGTSVRVAKGFSIRTGTSSGHRVQHTTMVEQGGGDLVLTNQGFSFVSKQKSARILLSHIMLFEAGSGNGTNQFGFSLKTDNARNNTHAFFGINPLNVNFIKCVLELLANGAPKLTRTPTHPPDQLPR